MEITTVSSEELSSYSVLRDSPLICDENNHLNENTGPQKSRNSNTNGQQPRQTKSLKLRTVPEPCVKNVKSSQNSNEKRKSSARSHTKEVAKRDLTISTQKVKLSNRPFIGVGSSSTNSTAFRNIFSSKKKEPRLFTSKNKVNKPGNIPASNRTETARSGAKSQTKPVVEIEVYMPVVDVENNTITYPKSRKPLVKIHPAKNVATMSREDKRGNKYLNIKNKEAPMKPRFYYKPKIDVNSNKNVYNSTTKGNLRNTFKPSFGKNVSSVKDVKNTTAKDVVKNKTTNVCRSSSIRDPKTKAEKVISAGKSRVETATATDSKGQKMTEKVQNLLRDITFDMENVPIFDTGEIQENTNFTPPTVDEHPRKLPRKNSSREVKDTCLPDHKRVRGKAGKMSSAVSCDFVEDEDLDSRPRAAIGGLAGNRHRATSSQRDDDLDDHEWKRQGHQRRKPNSRSLQKDPKPRNARKYKQLNTDKISLERKESTFSSPASLTKISRNENGWRRTIPKNSFSSEGFPAKSKWRRNIKDDGLTMDCWIERCKYLQSRQQCFQTSSEINNWRPS